MQKPIRFAFDLGGVIIQRRGEDNFLVQQSLMSVKLTIQKFSPQNVFIISKAKQKYQQKNIDFLTHHNFFTQTGFLIQNLHFVNQRQQKGPLGQQLSLTYILDDAINVAQVAVKFGFTPILFGDHEIFVKENQNVLNAKNWKHFREVLQSLNNSK